jgi:prepilin-type N-terminal cleavage/methylation domain-containing protein
MEEEGMSIPSVSDKRGLTLIELLVGMVICGFAVAGTYRLFVAQGKAYAVQEQVVEVQQNIRGSMEILTRDLRMAGFDDEATPLVTITRPSTLPEDNAITVRYEHNGAPYEVRYWLDEASRLNRQETKNGLSTAEVLLENVVTLRFSYGVDGDGDGAMDDLNGNGAMDDWVAAGDVGDASVVAVRVSLAARPEQTNPDVQAVSPRTLVSAVTLRNLTFTR